MPRFIEVHQDEVKTVVNVDTITHCFQQGGRTTICFVGGDDSGIKVKESLNEIMQKIG